MSSRPKIRAARRRFLAPEVVQTSATDCGPATLKCLFEGFGVSISYGRLREACQTSVDGTSIDTMEEIANRLGLEAEQLSLPADHLGLPEAAALPCLVVTQLPSAITHFVVVWRRHGRYLQVMDPAVGRRWIKRTDFERDVYRHAMPVGADDWREFAASDDFQRPLSARMRALGVSNREAADLSSRALQTGNWQSFGALDAATRLAAALVEARSIQTGRQTAALLASLCAEPHLIPQRFWSVREGPIDCDGQQQVIIRGAVLVKVKGRRPDAVSTEELSAELKLALEEKPATPWRDLLGLIRNDGRWTAAVLMIGLVVIAVGLATEALLFRGLFDLSTQLGSAGQRLTAMGALVIFSLLLLILEASIFLGDSRLSRAVESRLRIAFLAKIPKLSDRYFQSRLTSDMAERSHTIHHLRHIPDLSRQFLHACLELVVTAGAVTFLEPAAAPFMVAAVLAGLLPNLLSQASFAERDSRARTHAAGLMRFYLDAALGLQAIRAHGAESNVRRAHETLLGEWAAAALRVQKAAVTTEGIQMTLLFGTVASLFLSHPLTSASIGRLLLLVYWALNLPVIAGEIGTIARQYSRYRNLTLRTLEPLGAAEEQSRPENSFVNRDDRRSKAPRIEFIGVRAEAAGHVILDSVDALIEPGSHVAIIGPSGAGKSSLAGILLGWLQPSSGQVQVDGHPLDIFRMREQTAWVDPAIHLWNQSLDANLHYGVRDRKMQTGDVVDAAMLRAVLENLPDGLNTRLGESGGLVSGGEGQRVRFGRAMARPNAPVVILDEPFRGLDRSKREELLRRARALWKNSTLLCITHDIRDTASFDQVLVMENGRIAEAARPKDLLDDPDSRYAALWSAEERAQEAIWNGPEWRRIRVHNGQVLEEVSRTSEVMAQPEAEVA